MGYMTLGQMTTTEYTIAAFYHFTQLDDADRWEGCLRERGQQLELLGTLLLADEGVNATIAGTADAVESFLSSLRADPRFDGMKVKYSSCSEPPFGYFRLKRKREIVSFRQPAADPRETVGTYVAAEQWNDLIRSPDVITIDTRNAYEVALGKFEGAIDPGTDNFTEFAAWVNARSDELKQQKVAMYCTGGIRCEKATAYLKTIGINEVYHLEGGILNYLEKIPPKNSLWQGECFVFDNRVAVDHNLKPSKSFKNDPDTGRPVETT